MRRNHLFVALAAAAFAGQSQAQGPEMQAMDMMPMADADTDGKVTLEEYTKFSEQGWGFVSQGKDKVKVAELDQMGQLAFFGIAPDGEGFVTRKMYLDAVPARFKLFDADKNGSLNSDEINGRAMQPN
jgi:hypothetical protein